MQARTLDSADVDEGVLAAVVRLDEAVALGGVEPLYGSRSHGNCLSRVECAGHERGQPSNLRCSGASRGRALGRRRLLVRLSTDSVWPLWRFITSPLNHWQPIPLLERFVPSWG